MAAVTISDLRKSFGATPVLKGVSLEIRDGEFLTLVGPSGCGKSTLLRAIAGLERHDSGAIAIGGRSVDSVRPKARDVAMVFQSYALYPHMTVAQNLALPLRMRRLSYWQRLPLVGRFLPGTRATQAGIAADVREVAKSLEIEHLLERKPLQLSGGQRQRVAVGRAIVRRPHVFLMDEPLSNLDAKLRVTMRAEIAELHKRLGVTFIYVTHDQAEAMTMSDRVAVMLDGELLQVAPPHDVYADPADRRVAEFIGSPSINLIDGRVSAAGTIDAAGTSFAVAHDLPPGAAVTLGIRPEALALADGGAPAIAASTIAGRVRLIEHLGADMLVHLDVAGAGRPVILRVPPREGLRLRTEQTVHVAAQPDQILLFGAGGERLRARGSTVVPLRGHA